MGGVPTSGEEARRGGCGSRNDEIVRQWVADNGLTLHPTKTRIVDLRTTSFDFLGYSFRDTKHGPRKKSLKKLKDTIRQKTSRKVEGVVEIIHGGNTINRRAGCGKPARPVRREGRPKSIGLPCPYLKNKGGQAAHGTRLLLFQPGTQ